MLTLKDNKTIIQMVIIKRKKNFKKKKKKKKEEDQGCGIGDWLGEDKSKC